MVNGIRELEMKRYFFLIITSMLLAFYCTAGEATGNTADATLHWYTNMAEAQKAAEESDRPILVNFTGSDWCRWCIALSGEVLSQQTFIDYAAKELVTLKIDFPRRKQLPEDEVRENNLLAGKYGVRGFPTLVLLDTEGKLIARTGYRKGGADSYVEHLKGLLDRK